MSACSPFRIITRRSGNFLLGPLIVYSLSALLDGDAELSKLVRHLVRVRYIVQAADSQPDVSCLLVSEGMKLQPVRLEKEIDGLILFVRRTADAKTVSPCLLYTSRCV